jgi:octaprenyl-diphosphate synthase
MQEQRYEWLREGMPEIAREMLNVQGKELRARLVFLTAQLLGPITPAHVSLACAIECIHTASLLHDDVLDQGNMRRGRPCTHRIWGNTAAVLSGDWWLAKGFFMLLQVGHLDVIARVQKAMIQLVQGQLADCLMPHHGDRSAYLTMIQDKTACLFAVSAAGSSMISGGTKDQVHGLESYGMGVGMAYQLHDDAWEYGEHPEKWDGGHDFFQEKTTYPVILMRERGHEPEYPQFLAAQKQARLWMAQGRWNDGVPCPHSMPGLGPSLETVYHAMQAFVAETSLLAETYRRNALLEIVKLWGGGQLKDLLEYSDFSKK